MDKREINDGIAYILIIAFLLFTTIKYKYVARETSKGWKGWASLWRSHPIVRMLPLPFAVLVLAVGLQGDVLALVLGGIGTIVFICQVFWIQPWIRMLEWQCKVLDRYPWVIIAINAVMVLIGALWFLISAAFP